MRYAMSSGSGPGLAGLWTISISASSTSASSPMSMTDISRPSNRPARPLVVTTAVGAASSNMKSIRAEGITGSIARYAAPAFNTASMATIACDDRSRSSATQPPGTTPALLSLSASQFAASSSSR
ncbi:Uncharacterised protein [Mycobacteroides abscessus subsp. abscessus]|nr:Uncharacterised protein [Mycobacteroides abscessus subsp. abscessus]